MNEQPFTIGGVIKEGWELTKANLGFLLGYQIIIYIVVLLTAIPPENPKWAIFHLLASLFIILAKMGLYKSILLITVGIQPTFAQLYQNWRLIIYWILANFFFGILVTIGLILLIVPGCYWLAKYGLFPFFLLDKGIGPINAMKQSGLATKGIRWHIFLLFLACFGLNILGLLLFGIGLLFTLPITLFAVALVYRQYAVLHA